MSDLIERLRTLADCDRVIAQADAALESERCPTST